jgi:TRAP-type C4-dicarboxylate transport system substrate-binding protein
MDDVYVLNRAPNEEAHMPFTGWKIPNVIALAAAVALPTSLALDAAQAEDRSPDKTYVMKIAIPTIGDATHQFSKNFAAAVERDSHGRIKPQIFPASQLGSIPRMIEGAQFGTIECINIPPEFFVGVDERFEVMAAPGLVGSMDQAQRLVADPAVLKLMLSLGADKGLHGIAMLTVNPNELVARTPINHIADVKGKKIRVFASQFETVPFARLGATPVAMTLGDVLPALQQGAIDGALAGIPVLAAMHFKDAAKYVTHVGQPTVFSMVELSKKWFDTLPPDLQLVVEKDAATESVAINPVAIALVGKAFQTWTDSGGVVIKLQPDEHASLINTLSATADEVASRKPAVSKTYQIVKDAAQRVR